MRNIKILIIFCVLSTSAAPTSWIQRITESMNFEKLENYVPKATVDLPRYHYSTFVDDKGSTRADMLMTNEVVFKKVDENNRRLKSTEKFLTAQIQTITTNSIDASESNTQDFTTEKIPRSTSVSGEVTSATTELVTESTTVLVDLKYSTVFENNRLNPVFEKKLAGLLEIRNSSRPVREELNDEAADSTENNSNDDDSDNNESGNEEKGTNDKRDESKESSEEEEEEDGNMITSLLSALLGGLSRPDGTVDLEALVGLLGSLSTQNDDGTYDFSGLTDLLMSFFGGGGEEGGGSNFGAFLGGIAGAFIKGVVNPPGAQGAGIFSGNLLAGVLPALSGAAPAVDGQMPPKSLDIGGFLTGFLSSISKLTAGSSGNGDNGIGGGEMPEGGGGSKFQILKAIFSVITTIFTSSSASKH